MGDVGEAGEEMRVIDEKKKSGCPCLLPSVESKPTTPPDFLEVMSNID
jgi:hypothetical protein